MWSCTLYFVQVEWQSDSDSLPATGSSYTLLFQAELQWDHCRAGRGVIIYIVLSHSPKLSNIKSNNKHHISPLLSGLFPASASSFLGQAMSWRWQGWSGNCRSTGRIARSDVWKINESTITSWSLFKYLNTNHLQSKQHHQPGRKWEVLDNITNIPALRIAQEMKH